MKEKLLQPGRLESIAFLQQLLMYLNNDQTLHDTLHICDQLFKGKKQYAFISRLSRSIREGHSWTESVQSVLSSHAQLYNLGWAKSQEGLIKIAHHTFENVERQNRLVQSLATSMVYPIFVFTGLVVIIIVYQKVIQPRFYAYLPTETTWFGSMVPLALGSTLLVLLIGTVYVLINPLKKGFFASIMKLLPGTGKLCSLRVWELLLVFLDIRIAGGFTLWDACTSAQKVYGSTNEVRQIARIKQSLFESRNLQHVVLQNHHIPDCIRNILYSGLNSNNLETSLPSMQRIISWQLDQAIAKLTALSSPVAIALCGWAVLGLCMDILIPIHRFLSGGII